MTVSIIVPVYNVEKYIARCLKSISNQTYEDIEIILVDDGSTDSSGKICDEFAQKDSRAVVIHKENGGLSSARNQGMKFAKGDYITFLDSDDYFATDFVENALQLCVDNKAEISILNMEYVDENINEELAKSYSNELTILSSEEAIKESLYQRLFSCCAPGKLYKRATLDGVEFPFGRLSEDLAVCHLILNNANNIVYSTRAGYYYRQQQKSIMHTFNSRRLDALEWTGKIEEFCEKNYPQLLRAAKCRAFNVAVHLALDLPDPKGDNFEDYKRIWREVTRTRTVVITDKECRFREKAAACLSYLGISLLKRVWDSSLAIKK